MDRFRCKTLCMTLLRLATLLALLSAACADAGPDTTDTIAFSATCEPKGAYLQHLQERSGDCGAIDDQVQVFGTPPIETDLTCTGKQALSEDGCALTSQLKCVGTGDLAGASSTFNGIVHWNTGGTLGKGTMSVTFDDKVYGTFCESLYDVTWTKID